MRTISITIDELLLGHLDDAARTAEKTRSELFRLALQEWLDGRRRRELAAKDRAGYAANPIRPDEFEGLIGAQAVVLQDPSDSRDGDDW